MPSETRENNSSCGTCPSQQGRGRILLAKILFHSSSCVSTNWRCENRRIWKRLYSSMSCVHLNDTWDTQTIPHWFTKLTLPRIRCCQPNDTSPRKKLRQAPSPGQDNSPTGGEGSILPPSPVLSMDEATLQSPEALEEWMRDGGLQGYTTVKQKLSIFIIVGSCRKSVGTAGCYPVRRSKLERRKRLPTGSLSCLVQSIAPCYNSCR